MNKTKLTDFFACIKFPLACLTMWKILCLLIILTLGRIRVLLRVSILMSVLIAMMMVVFLIARLVMLTKVIVTIGGGTIDIIFTLDIQVSSVYHSFDKCIIKNTYVRLD